MKIQVTFSEVKEWIKDSIDPEIAKGLFLGGTANHKLQLGYHVEVPEIFDSMVVLNISDISICANRVFLHFETSENLNKIIGSLIGLLLSKDNKYAKNFSMLSLANSNRLEADLSKVEALSSFLKLMTIKAALKVETEYIEFDADLKLNK